MAIKSARFTQGTTPALELTVEGEAIQDSTVYITIDQGDFKLTKSSYKNNPDIVMVPVFPPSAAWEEAEQIATDVTVFYSQAETLALRPGHAKIQVEWVFEDGSADATELGRIEIEESLYKGVKVYG